MGRIVDYLEETGQLENTVIFYCGYVGMEANLFDVKDFSLLSNLYVYPSLTESGRWRIDYSVDTKYDLPLNFYVKLVGTLNYDNRPAVEGNEVDYVLSFSFGWEL